jgi:hypothetical protein
MASSLIGVGRERKGSMFLRSDEMHYGRAVLNTNWHQAREAEPKDYDMNHAPVRDLRMSTYKHLGTVSNSLPDSTYTDHFIKQRFNSQPSSEPANLTVKKTDRQIEKELGRSKHATVVMPRHDSAKYPHHYVSTHCADFRPFTACQSMDASASNSQEQKQPDSETTDAALYTDAVRRCISQFADTTNHRRVGRNTWQDESGVYANTLLKSACPYYARTYTLMPGGVKPSVEL